MKELKCAFGLARLLSNYKLLIPKNLNRVGLRASPLLTFIRPAKAQDRVLSPTRIGGRWNGRRWGKEGAESAELRRGEQTFN